MNQKATSKQLAITLRKQGKTYNEILAVVPVAKSTLSLWLREVGLSSAQVQRITVRRRAAQQKGALARKKHRIDETSRIFQTAKAEIGSLTARERLLVGAALYWAEGSKERQTTISQAVDFGNTDPVMMRYFVDFLREALNVTLSQMVFSLYLHQSHKHRLEEVQTQWRNALGLANLKFSWVYFKRHNPKTVRKNTGEKYLGTLRVYVRNSSSLQRKISGWIYGINGADWDIV